MAEDDQNTFGPYPEHKPYRPKGQRLDYLTDEELRPLLKWKPFEETPGKPFPGVDRAPLPEPASQDPSESRAPRTLGGEPSPSASWVKNLEADLVRVIDGDSVLARLPDGSEVRVRLRGFNAPELGSTGGEQSRAALERMLASGKLKLSDVDDSQGSYGRMVATVGVGDTADIGTQMAQEGFGSAARSSQAPRGNDWRQIRRSLPPDALAYSYELAEKQKRYGLLQRQGRLNPNDPEYQDFLQQTQEFTDKYAKPWREKSGRKTDMSNVPPKISAAIDKILRRAPVEQAPGWQEAAAAREFTSKPHGVAEWTAWGKSLNPAEKALWQKLQTAEAYYQQHAPPYRKREYFGQPQYLEHRKLYDKFLHLTTERLARRKVDQPPPQGRRRRRRRAELPQELMQALA